MSLPSPLNSDPLLDCYSNYEFYNDIQFDCLDELISDFSAPTLNETICKPQSGLSSNSIIDFDLYQDQDIDLDFFLCNHEFQEPEDPHQIISVSTSPNGNYPLTKPINDISAVKTQRKTKQKSILPYSIRDINIENYGKSNNDNVNLKNQDLINGKPGDRIYLSKEEKNLLIRDGFQIPTHLPLTKSEERALKNVRRKIRNKISAKNSRAKKETYVEGLEQRLLQCSKENTMLRQKLAETEKDKITLFQQVVNLQKQVSKFVPHATTRSTSLMLLLTFMFLLSPIFDPRQLWNRFAHKNTDENAKFILPGRTRILLQEPETSTEIEKQFLVTMRQSPPWKVKSIENNSQSKNFSILVVNKTREMQPIKDL